MTLLLFQLKHPYKSHALEHPCTLLYIFFENLICDLCSYDNDDDKKVVLGTGQGDRIGFWLGDGELGAR